MSNKRREGSNPSFRATSEQSPLCSDAFLCLRQKRRHPPAPLLLLSNCDPLSLGSGLGTPLRGGFSYRKGISMLTVPSTWSQSSLCDHVFSCLRLRQKDITRMARYSIGKPPEVFFLYIGAMAQTCKRHSPARPKKRERACKREQNMA